jgi:uncharacterized protein YjgD (DUF1641 family)
MSVVTDDRLAVLEDKVDRLADAMALLAEEAVHQRRRRESFEELTADLMPLATNGLASVSAELDDAEIDLGDLKRLALRLASSADRLDGLLVQLDSLSQLAGDAMPLVGEGMAVATAKLDELDQKGYFAFARQAGGILDEVVTNYTEEDVAALGENVVLILDTVRQMTQPEVMGLLSSTATAIHDQYEDAAAGTEAVPSMLSLLGQMRDPEVRLGLQRALNMLRSISGPGRQIPNQGGN